MRTSRVLRRCRSLLVVPTAVASLVKIHKYVRMLVHTYVRDDAYKRRPRECRDLCLRAALHRSVVPPHRVDRDEDAG